AAQAVGAAIALALHRRQPPLKLVFNVAKLTIEAAVALLVFRAVVGGHPLLGLYGWLGGLAAIAVVDILGALVVQSVISVSEGRPPSSALFRTVVLAVAAGFTTGSIALLGVTVIGRDPAGVWLLVIPAGMLFLAYRAYVAEQARQASIGMLHEANRILQDADSLETAVMELLALGVRDAILTQLENEHRLLGTVMIANRLGDRFSFDHSDRQLFETLATQASFSLQNDRYRQVLAQRTRERAEFEHKAHHDSLTLLPNRALLVERVRDALARREGADTDVAVMYVDLDDFKTVNDSLGHAAGDAL